MHEDSEAPWSIAGVGETSMSAEVFHMKPLAIVTNCSDQECGKLRR